MSTNTTSYQYDEKSSSTDCSGLKVNSMNILNSDQFHDLSKIKNLKHLPSFEKTENQKSHSINDLSRSSLFKHQLLNEYTAPLRQSGQSYIPHSTDTVSLQQLFGGSDPLSVYSVIEETSFDTLQSTSNQQNLLDVESLKSKNHDSGSDGSFLGKSRNITPVPLTSSLTISDIVQIAFDIYTTLDVNQDRSISIVEFHRALNIFDSSTSYSDEEVSRIFQIADLSKTNTLNFNEFLLVCSCLHMLHSTFGCTKVDAQLLKQALTSKYHGSSMELIEHMIKKNGEKGHIDFPALLNLYISHNESSQSHVDTFIHHWITSTRTSFFLELDQDDITPWQDFIAGSFAGLAIILVGHPFDTIKVRFQTASAHKFKNALDCLRQTIFKEGPFALYKGMSGPMYSIPLINALVFYFYAQGKSFFLGDDVDRHLTLTEIGLAGAYAGLLNCILACPVELVKTRLQIQYGGQGAFKGPFDCCKHIIRTSGIKGLFRGMSATIYREVPGYGGQFYVYEGIKRMCVSHNNKEASTLEMLSAGGFAGMAGWVLSYPMDIIKSHIQSEPWGKKSPYKKHPWLFDGGFFDAGRQIIQKNGYRGLWKGFDVCLLRAWPANAAGFFAYEAVLNLVKSTDNSVKSL